MPRTRSIFCRLALTLMAGGVFFAAAPRVCAEPAEPTIEFNRDVRPILSDKCFACHGPDKGQRKGDLRLDLEKGALAEHDGRHAIVAGKVDDSELYKRITHTSKRKKMPPAKFGKTLSQEEIELLRLWIEQGAGWQSHWSISKPARSDPPAGAGHLVDRFIGERLGREGKNPSAPADRRTLIRRISFDLTGLPPSPAEVDAFLADKDPAAYDRLVDRLLASELYNKQITIY